MSNHKWVSQLRKGLVELCVLAALREREAYGYEILQRLNAIDGLAITESTVYPLLARLSGSGLVNVRSAPSPNGPPRRYYRLTDSGVDRLKEMERHWYEVQQSVGSILQRGTT